MSGSLASIDVNGRVTVSVELIAVIGWRRGKKLAVMAELGEFGLVNIYRADALDLHIRNLRQSVGDIEGPGRRDAENVLADRYRTLTIYSDGRLQLTREVASWLGFYPFPETNAYLFAEPHAPGLALMTLDRRVSRASRVALSLYAET